MQFIYLDPREEGENITVYFTVVEKKIIQENENKGKKANTTKMEAYLLTLLRLRRIYDIIHLTFLYFVSERPVSNTTLTWVSFVYETGEP